MRENCLSSLLFLTSDFYFFFFFYFFTSITHELKHKLISSIIFKNIAKRREKRFLTINWLIHSCSSHHFKKSIDIFFSQHFMRFFSLLLFLWFLLLCVQWKRNRDFNFHTNLHLFQLKRGERFEPCSEFWVDWQLMEFAINFMRIMNF